MGYSFTLGNDCSLGSESLSLCRDQYDIDALPVKTCEEFRG